LNERYNAARQRAVTYASQIREDREQMQASLKEAAEIQKWYRGVLNHHIRVEDVQDVGTRRFT
jgi:hypothetical protein